MLSSAAVDALGSIAHKRRVALILIFYFGVVLMIWGNTIRGESRSAPLSTNEKKTE